MTLNETTVASTLEETHGNISAAASRLGVRRAELAAYVAAHERLATLVDDCRAELVDYAETQLRRAIGEGHEWAIRFALDSTRASPRGWRKMSASATSDAPSAAPGGDGLTYDELARMARRQLGLDDEGEA